MEMAAGEGPVRLLHVVQGALGVTDDPSVEYTALIGSCVIVCAHDPVAKLGGMTHFQFPGDGGDGRFGGVAISGLIQRLLDMGAQSDRLEVKLFGGAKVDEGCRDIGKSNAEFALEILAQSGAIILASDLGADTVRRVMFRPTTGDSTAIIQTPDMPIEALAG